jgi:hypothetical protein
MQKKDKNKKWPIRERIKNQQPIETPQWPMYYSHMQHMWGLLLVGHFW